MCRHMPAPVLSAVFRSSRLSNTRECIASTTLVVFLFSVTSFGCLVQSFAGAGIGSIPSKYIILVIHVIFYFV